ncbi:MFS transporter [Amaricoccus sp.]|uniref:MFS transporter n=2 Tax=Amaricoccus sp. TaxID=1872485 RepID=UPI002D1FADBF|nr:MFS transporter [Amaricoccus sp.]
MDERMDRRGVFAWMLFDWANQPFQTLIVTFVFGPYFVARVVGDPVAGQAHWATATAIGGAAVAVLAPLLGAVADRTGARKRWIAAFSAPFVIGCAGLWIAAPEASPLWLILAFFVLAYVGSEFTLIFSNAMLPGLGPRREIGRISGSGWALGYAGGLVALALVLALLTPAPGGTRTLAGLDPVFGLSDALGEPARAVGPASALWYLVFALPLFLFAPDAAPAARLGKATREGLRDLRATLRQIRRFRGFFTYLLASMVYRDALAGLFAFGGIYAAGVLGWGMFELGLFGIVAAGAGALGAWLGGRADRAFGPRPVIVAAIWMLIGVGGLALMTTREAVLGIPVAPGSPLPDRVFFFAGAVLGAGSGILQAASRTLLVHLAEGRVASAQAFGLYAVSGKVTAFAAPALIAVTTAATGSQRLGFSPVIALFLIGLLLLYWAKQEYEQPGDLPA